MDELSSWGKLKKSLKNDLIFINIPSYKDPELWDTVEAFIAQAKHPENLHFGITNQFYDLELDKAKAAAITKSTVFLDNINPGSILGAAPCRKNSHKFYSGEEYYLNIDSHMRVIANWDEKIIKDFNETEDRLGKSVFTGYSAPYDVIDGKDVYDESLTQPTYYMSEENQKSYKTAGIPQFCGLYTDRKKESWSPYVSGHFFFTRGSYVEKAPFSDQIVFTEEEIWMALRFFTSGINLLNPAVNYVFHRYGRPARKLAWDEFPEKWYPAAEASKQFALDIILNNKVDNNIGLFSERTLESFETYTGLRFKDRYASPALIAGQELTFKP